MDSSAEFRIESILNPDGGNRMWLRNSWLGWLLCLTLGASSAPLPGNQVFHFDFKRLDANTMTLDWTIEPGYFLYQKRISIHNSEPKYLHIGSISYPAAQIQVSKQGKKHRVYRDKLTLAIPVLAKTGGEVAVTVHYQGCSDAGFCYPPQSQELELSFDADRTLTQVYAPEPTSSLVSQPRSVPSAQGPSLPGSLEIKNLFLSTSPIWILASFYGFGLLLAFTPCVLPMIPVLSSIIVGQGRTISTRKAFGLSLSYVLSMAMTYGLIGAVIARLGANLQIIVQSPWVLGTFSLVLVALALSMFGIYELRLPRLWQAKLSQVTHSQASGQYLNAAVMGALSILILSPCVTPPLIGALTYIAEAGSTFLGLGALFCLGMGMGTPLLLIGTSAGKWLPKAGQWMSTLTFLLGMILLGLAVHLLERLLSVHLSMLLWSGLFISCGLGLKPFSANRSRGTLAKQAVAGMMILFGGFILYGAAAGHTDPWQPLLTRSATSHKLKRTVVTTVAQAQHVLDQAKHAKQPVMLDFYATWCETCQRIETDLIQTPDLAAYEDKIFFVQVDLSSHNEDSNAILAYFHVIAPPTLIFYDQAGKPRPDLQWAGDLDLPTLLNRVEQVVSGKA